jgi:hypothetical protein
MRQVKAIRPFVTNVKDILFQFGHYLKMEEFLLHRAAKQAVSPFLRFNANICQI